ncbi:peptidoglycan editing factor PgeF [Dechloromonas sp. ZY10]|uniref:peptidoglycan editing factor PgeF n=1 Tax=Dechloromonas aquae TaxID=2664436 RepID=UPI0035289AE7
MPEVDAVDIGLLIPEWPAPSRVRAWQTLRTGGYSSAPWAGFNLGDHVGDDPLRVAANRAALRGCLPAEPCWLRQVHGTLTVDAGKAQNFPEADASWTRSPGVVCVVMTADCLPVLFCDRQGTVVAAAHAGWRGLLGGVLESTVAAMTCAPGNLLAWFGPAIGPEAFEVGDEVRIAFVKDSPAAAGAFVPAAKGKWLADLGALARQRLNRLGVTAIYGGGECTYHDSARYFSYRRDGQTGRMATLICLE